MIGRRVFSSHEKGHILHERKFELSGYQCVVRLQWKQTLRRIGAQSVVPERQSFTLRFSDKGKAAFVHWDSRRTPANFSQRNKRLGCIVKSGEIP